MRRRLLIVLVLLTPVLVLLGPTLWSGKSVAFRDAGHFYYPLFFSTQQAWKDGIPLWNPQEFLGLPVVGDVTSSVFYPGKLVFALPLPYSVAFNLYIMLHLLLASGAIYWVARRWNCSCCGGLLAATSYVLGGAVLSQTCNLVFLVGAAWLPLACWAVDGCLRKRSWRHAAIAGVILALMILGGDPQLAYNVLLFAAAYAWLLRRAQRRPGEDSRPQRQSPRDGRAKWRQHRLVLLLIMGAVGGTLAAIQVLPAWQSSRRSLRASFDRPRSIYELPLYWSRCETMGDAVEGAAAGFCAPPSEGSHAEQAYDFSLPPWRLSELVWSNVGGRLMPENRRWLSTVPAAGRVWAGSYYLGLLPLLLACGAWKLRTTDARLSGLSGLALLATIASFGWYGLGWLSHELAHLLSWERPEVAGPVGGLYWLMNLLVPGYANFRYPAKLFVIGSFALSLLAALGWDRVWEESDAGKQRRKKLTRCCVFLAGLSLIVMLAVLLTRQLWLPWLNSSQPDEFFGPLSIEGATWDVMFGFVQCMALAALTIWLLRWKHRARQAIMVGIVTIELLLANAWLVPLANNKNWDLDPDAFRRFDPLVRGYRHPSLGYPWNDSSPKRIEQAVEWESDTNYGRHVLLTPGRAEVDSIVSIRPRDMGLLLDLIPETDEEGQLRSDPAILREFGVSRSFIYRQSRKTMGFYGYPQARIARRIEVIAPLTAGCSLAEAKRRTQEVADRALRSRGSMAIVETSEKLPTLNQASQSVAEQCQLWRASATRLEVHLDLQATGLLIISDQFDPDWQATLKQAGSTRKLNVYRTNRVMRGMIVPAGKSVVQMRYRPRLLWLGMLISATSLLGVIVLLICGSVGARTAQHRTN